MRAANVAGSFSVRAVACRHCRRTGGVWRRRGLCRVCHADAAVRSRYPRKYGGVPDRNGGYSLPAAATAALPGSAAKVAVLAERAGLGVALFHPLDAPRSHSDRPAGGSVAGAFL